jgi:hypothetical protein
MLGRLIDKAVTPLAWYVERDDMRRLGLRTTMRLARTYNRVRHRRHQEYRRAQYLHHFEQLIEENGPTRMPVNEITDGWALDSSGSLPHLGQMLDDTAEIIGERGGVKRMTGGKPFIQDILTGDDVKRYPSILDFATSSEVLKPVIDYLGFVPHLSGGLPPGIRLTESSAAFDDTPDAPPRASQLHHLDYHDGPMVYVIVALKDITDEMGPFHYLPAAASQKAAEVLRYRSRGRPYRITDGELYAVTDEREVKKFSVPRGTVLFLDSSRCFHYGSRNAVKPRYQMFISYISCCRTDFTEVYRPLRTYEPRAGDSKLRKMVLDREFME